MKEVEPAPEYGQLVVVNNYRVGCIRIRMYCGHQYNWNTSLIVGDIVNIPTDQTEAYSIDHSYPLRDFKEIYFNGILIYKKPLIQRIWDSIFRR